MPQPILKKLKLEQNTLKSTKLNSKTKIENNTYKNPEKIKEESNTNNRNDKDDEECYYDMNNTKIDEPQPTKQEIIVEIPQKEEEIIHEPRTIEISGNPTSISYENIENKNPVEGEKFEIIKKKRRVKNTIEEINAKGQISLFFNNVI